MSSAIVSTVGSVVGIVGGISNLLGGDGGGSGGGQTNTNQGSAANPATYDPFAPYRGAEGELYNNYLMGNKSTDPSQMPGFASFQSGVVQPGMDATKSSMAASGQFNSGAESLALNKQANQGYYGFMTDYLNRLTQGSGAAQNPATGGQSAIAGAQQAQANQAGAVGAGVGAIGQIGTGLQGLYNSYNNYSAGTSTNPQSYNSNTYIDNGQFDPHAGY